MLRSVATAKDHPRACCRPAALGSIGFAVLAVAVVVRSSHQWKMILLSEPDAADQVSLLLTNDVLLVLLPLYLYRHSKNLHVKIPWMWKVLNALCYSGDQLRYQVLADKMMA
jgi:hypothetical protein